MACKAPELGDEGVHEEDVGGDGRLIGHRARRLLMATDAGAWRSRRPERRVVGTEEPSRVMRSPAGCGASLSGRRLEKRSQRSPSTSRETHYADLEDRF